MLLCIRSWYCLYAKSNQTEVKLSLRNWSDFRKFLRFFGTDRPHLLVTSVKGEMSRDTPKLFDQLISACIEILCMWLADDSFLTKFRSNVILISEEKCTFSGRHCVYYKCHQSEVKFLPYFDNNNEHLYSAATIWIYSTALHIALLHYYTWVERDKCG